MLAGHRLVIQNGNIRIERYWEVHYNLDFDRTPKYFEENLRYLIEDSIKVHTRSDVPIGAYVSGGVDSSIVAAIASRVQSTNGDQFQAFNGKFSVSELYDETKYAVSLTDMHSMALHQVDITSQDFVDSISKIIYH